IKANNYLNAFITRRDLSKGNNTRVIQLATKPAGKNINWEEYAAAGELFALPEGNTVKIMTLSFADDAESNAHVNSLKTKGYKDAFAKTINDKLIHRITEFEAGRILNFGTTELSMVSTSAPLVQPTTLETKAPTVIEEEKSTASSLFVVPPKIEEPIEEEVLEEAEVLTAREVVIPDNYNVVGKRLEPKPELTPKSKEIIEKKPAKKVAPKTKTKAPSKAAPVSSSIAKIPVPKTRAKVKRNSAYNLQMIMKQEGVYKNSLDGFYGPGTKKGWDAIQQTNRQLKKYILLTSMEEEMTERSADHILQHYVNTLDANPKKAINAFENSKEAVAKAYQAYAVFTQEGPGKKVNNLMNAAVKQAFAKTKLENKPPFDYTVTYDYKKLDQLILHLKYIQSSAEEQVEAPAWLFVRHPKAAKKAFAPYANFNEESYPIQDAMTLFEWPEFKLLETILKDLNTNKVSQKNKSSEYLRSRLLLAPQTLSQDAHVSISTWNKSLWTKMDQWGKEDALHEKLLTPLKLSYFQTLVRLEDYFMDKGFDSRTATALGLKVMKTFVEEPLSQY
ncbi:MAG: hypothetical protein AB8F74_09035, partial [Saprospiraceae bacterium]